MNPERTCETREGYHVFVGGGFGEKQAVGRQVFQGVTVEALRPLLERMLKVYLRRRNGTESFQSFSARHDLGKLQEVFGEDAP